MECQNQKCTKHHRKTLGIFHSRFEEEEKRPMLLICYSLLQGYCNCWVNVFNYRKFLNLHNCQSLEPGPELSSQFPSFSIFTFDQYRKSTLDQYKTNLHLVNIKSHLWEEVETAGGGFQQILRQIPMWIGHFPHREGEQVRQAID